MIIKTLERVLQELRYIDPTKIKKVREVKKSVDKKTSIQMTEKIEEYYIYNEKGLGSAGTAGTNQGLKIAVDSNFILSIWFD